MTLPDIIINYRKETAIHATTGATCDIISKRGVWYTDMAGLIALEKGTIAGKSISSSLTSAHNRKSPRLELLKPIKINKTWWYAIQGWSEYRISLLKLPKETIDK